MAQQIRKERITKVEFYRLGGFSNSQLFRLQSRGGAWRYYRRMDDPIIFVGDGQYRRRSDCSLADIERARQMRSAVNAGLI